MLPAAGSFPQLSTRITAQHTKIMHFTDSLKQGLVFPQSGVLAGSPEIMKKTRSIEITVHTESLKRGLVFLQNGVLTGSP